MSRGTRAPGSRVGFSFLMVFMLMFSMSPLAFAQDADATPEAPVAPVETEVPTEEPTEVATEEPIEVPTEEVAETPVDVPTEEATEIATEPVEAPASDEVQAPAMVPAASAEGAADLEILAAPGKVLVYDSDPTPLTCARNNNVSVRVAPNLDPRADSVHIGLSDGSVRNLRFSSSNAGGYDVYTVSNITSNFSVVSAWAVVDSGVEGSVTVDVASARCNQGDGESGAQIVTVRAVPRAGGHDSGASVEGAIVTMTHLGTNDVVSGVIGSDNTFVTPSSIAAGPWEVTIDAWEQDHTRASTSIFVHDQPVTVDLQVQVISEMWVRVNVWTSEAPKIPLAGVTVTILDPTGTPVFEEVTPANGEVRTGNLSEPGTYLVVADGSEIGRSTFSHEIVLQGTYGDAISLRLLEQYSVTGTVTDEMTGEPVEGAVVTVEGTEFSTTTAADGSYSFSEVIEGDYTFVFSADGYLPLEVPATIAADSTVVNAALQSVTYPVTIVGETSDGGSAEGAYVIIDDLEDDAGEFQALAINPISGTLDADNGFNAGDLPVGTYEVTIDAIAQGYGVGIGTFIVPVEGPVVVALQLQAASVTINVTSADLDIDSTLPEDASWTVTSVANPALSMTGTFAADDLQLPATITVEDPVPVGSYLVAIEAGPDFEPYVTTITVTADSAEQTFNIVLEPVVEEPTTGLVAVIKLYCTDMSTVTFFDLDDLDDDQIDFLDENCVFGPATFTFNLVGDGTDEDVPLEIDEEGVGVVELNAGTYEVVEEGTLASTTIEVVAGDIRTIGVINPLGVADTAGIVVMQKLYCEGVDEVLFIDANDFNDDDIANLEDNCVFGDATFTFYLVGDGTDAHQQLHVDADGFDYIELEAGTYEIVEEGTLATTTIEVVAGDVISLVVINPMPVDGDDPADPEDGKTPGAPDDKDADGVVVTKLPATGSGVADTTGLMAIAAAAAAALAGAGALSLRKER